MWSTATSGTPRASSASADTNAEVFTVRGERHQALAPHGVSGGWGRSMPLNAGHCRSTGHLKGAKRGQALHVVVPTPLFGAECS